MASPGCPDRALRAPRAAGLPGPTGGCAAGDPGRGRGTQPRGAASHGPVVRNPLRMPLREQAFVSYAGRRGAVPIVPATFVERRAGAGAALRVPHRPVTLPDLVPQDDRQTPQAGVPGWPVLASYCLARHLRAWHLSYRLLTRHRLLIDTGPSLSRKPLPTSRAVTATYSLLFHVPFPIVKIRCVTQTREYPTTGQAAAASGARTRRCRRGWCLGGWVDDHRVSEAFQLRY